MFKILIADDESIIREGLASSIHWEELGCSIVGLAGNGLECIQYVEAFQPHILITDIHMPGKNGLDVAEHTLRMHPETKVILLSGYNDFEYARKAIELGAFNYLLKPTVYEHVVECIKKAIEAIMRQQQQREELAQFREVFKKQIKFYKKAFLQQLILKPMTDIARIKESLQLYGLEEEGPYTLLLLKVDRFDSVRQHFSEEEKQIMLLALEHRMNQFLEPSGFESVVPLKEDLYCIFIKLKVGMDDNDMMLVCEQLQSVMKQNYAQMTLSVGVSSRKPTVSELYLAYIEAAEALQHILYLGGESVIFYEGLKPMNDTPSESSHLYAETVKEIMKLLKAGNEAQCMVQLKQLFDLFQYVQEHPDTVKAVCLEMGAQIGGVIHAMGLEMPSRSGEGIYGDIMICETTEDYYKAVGRGISEVAGEVFRKTRTKHKKLVQKVLDLVEAHYQKDVSLSWVCDQIHMNSSYISRLIKNECGETFTQLLNRFRLEKAKSLLKEPTVKIYEVSEQVGFTDSQYFAMKFKKYTGMTPTEFRDHYVDFFA